MNKVTKAFAQAGHPIKRTKVQISFFKDLSQSECDLLALTTYPSAKKKTVYTLMLTFIVAASFALAIVALVMGGFEGVWGILMGAGLGVFVISFLIAVLSFPFIHDTLAGFYILDGAKRLRCGGFVRFLYALARVLSFIFSCALIFIIALLGGAVSGDDRTVVIGIPDDCEPEDVQDIYGIFFDISD